MLKVLIAPLDWGLGHTTRCIPLIESFRKDGWAITLAGEGAGAELLQATFPEIPLLYLKGYRIRYARKQVGWKIVQQIPQIHAVIQYEKKWLIKNYAEYGWDVIISDNRPGFRHPAAFNIYITHQLHIQTGFGKLLNRLASFFHQSYIKKFNELWIPDLEGSQNLAGKLAHPKISFLPTKYLGLISRLHPAEATPYHYDLLFLLSGPEPQRSLFEEIILKQIRPHHGKILLVRGTKNAIIRPPVPTNVEVIHLSNSHELNQYLLQSKFIICRSGYTTLMDLMRLKKKALLIPTPGQGEQEYLATHAKHQNYFPSIIQNEFKIDKALEAMEKFNYDFPFNESDFQLYETVVKNLNF
jgi:UDP:flavonoid glycosyltransferase YjiC (YdhE family)